MTDRTTMSPDQARRMILAGTAPAGLSVGGALSLSGREHNDMPTPGGQP